MIQIDSDLCSPRQKEGLNPQPSLNQTAAQQLAGSQASTTSMSILNYQYLNLIKAPQANGARMAEKYINRRTK